MELLLAFALGAGAGGLAVAGWTAWRRDATPVDPERDEELEQARREAAAARAARTAFFEHATHELRSPLSAILGYQELLRDNVFGELSPDAADAVHRIGRSGRHLANLVDGMVELSLLEAGQIEPDLDDVALAVPLSTAVEAFRKHAADRGMTATVELPDELPTIRTDAVRLARALDLLITTAARHPVGDDMTFQARVTDPRVAVTLGPVSPEALRPSEEAIDGLGIRLAVARRIGELLGGGLDLDVSGPDARTLTFHFRDA